MNIKFEDYQKLAQVRQEALESGYLDDNGDYVPAELVYNDSVYKVDLRLKGDVEDHYEHSYKWSFKVKVSGDDTLFGMKIFSLQHPKTRDYLNEWFFHEILEKAGLVALRYKFVDLEVNGKNMGVYALEESFEKRLIENNKKRSNLTLLFLSNSKKCV